MAVKRGPRKKARPCRGCGKDCIPQGNGKCFRCNGQLTPVVDLLYPNQEIVIPKYEHEHDHEYNQGYERE